MPQPHHAMCCLLLRRRQVRTTAMDGGSTDRKLLLTFAAHRPSLAVENAGAIFRPARDYPSDASSAIEFFRQRLRRGQPVALLDNLGNLAPGHAAAVEAH